MLRLNNLSKQFGTVPVLSAINLHLAKGEIHGLAGINGSGKTTLLKILFGHPIIGKTGGYAGEIFLDGKPCVIPSPKSAFTAGIAMVHQELGLLPQLSVADNINLTREPVYTASEKILGQHFAVVAHKKCLAITHSALSALGITIDPAIAAENLTLNLQQFVEVAREISRPNLKLLLLDEPTSSLNSSEAERLFTTIKKLAERGVSVLFVSHRFRELFSLCDNITVLRDGKITGKFRRSEFSAGTIAACMTGRTIEKCRRSIGRRNGSTILRLHNVSVSLPNEKIENLSIDIKHGEIFGFTSLSGHGGLAILPGIFGLYPTSGNILLGDHRLDHLPVNKRIRHGLFFLSEDRKEKGLLQQQSIALNLAFPAMHYRARFLWKRPWFPAIFPDGKAIDDHAEQWIQAFNITCHSTSQKVAQLSGGNQQKVCIAKALSLSPHILMINEPTRGIDVEAKERILDSFNTINKEKNITILIASNELEELRRICDRIAVLYEGRLVAILDAEEDEERFLAALLGEPACCRLSA